MLQKNSSEQRICQNMPLIYLYHKNKSIEQLEPSFGFFQLIFLNFESSRHQILIVHSMYNKLIKQMLSPNHQKYEHYLSASSKSIHKSNYTKKYATLKEETDRTSKIEYFPYHEFDCQSMASTEYSNRRTKLTNNSYSDSNILKPQKYHQKIQRFYNPDEEFYQKPNLQSSTVSTYNSLTKNSLWSGASTPKSRRTFQTYPESYLNDSLDWNFSKKVSRKNSGRNQIDQINKMRNFEKPQKSPLHTEVQLTHSRNSVYDEPIKTLPYDSLERQEIPMFLQKKQSIKERPKKVEHKTQNIQRNNITIDSFILGQSRGQGMYGSVHVARLKANGTIYALKKISKQIVIKNKMQSQLALQIKLQMFLNHPNILKLYHFFQDSQYVYLVMEYMEDGSLFDFMQKQNRIMSEKETAQIIIQISNALTYLHDLDIVHRDIKPQNIVISHGIRKLCDFGWATICTDRRSTYCGTFDYAAPQILQGKEYDGSVDLWCLGVLTYELLTRRVPFYNSSRQQSIRKIINSDKEGPVIPSSISPKCRNFIQSLMKKRCKERLCVDELHSHPFLALYLPKQRFIY